jgi:hypothetical protein
MNLIVSKILSWGNAINKEIVSKGLGGRGF